MDEFVDHNHVFFCHVRMRKSGDFLLGLNVLRSNIVVVLISGFQAKKSRRGYIALLNSPLFILCTGLPNSFLLVNACFQYVEFIEKYTIFICQLFQRLRGGWTRGWLLSSVERRRREGHALRA